MDTADLIPVKAGRNILDHSDLTDVSHKWRRKICISVFINGSLRAGSPLSHSRERRRAKRSGRKESGKEAPISRLAASPLCYFARSLVLQREPDRRLHDWVKRTNVRGG